MHHIFYALKPPNVLLLHVIHLLLHLFNYIVLVTGSNIKLNFLWFDDHDIFHLTEVIFKINIVKIVNDDVDLLLVFEQSFFLLDDSKRSAHNSDQHVHENQLYDNCTKKEC